MNTLLITLEYPPYFGGVANYYDNLVKFWPHPEKIHVLHNNDNLLTFNRLPLLSWLPALIHLKREIKKKNIDQVLVGQIWPLGWITYLVSKVIKIKYSIILHGTIFSSAIQQKRKRYFIIKILKKAEKIICANSYTASTVPNYTKNLDRIHVVNPGISIETNKKNSDRRIQETIKKFNIKNKYILLSVGRLVKRKGFDYVLTALPKVLNLVPNLVYVVIGSGEDEERLKALVKEMNLNNQVIFLNNVDDEEKQAWYSICDCFIMPSRVIEGDYEGFGIVYLEANLAGKPVIAGRSGGIQDVVKDGINGLLVNPESIDEICETIVKLAHDKDLRNKLGDNAKKFVVENFDWKKQISNIFVILTRSS